MIKKILTVVFLYFIFIVGVNAYTAYKQGDVVNYNGIDFYVLYDSDENSNVLTLLKAEPLSVDEVNTYGVGHINKYSSVSQNQAYNMEGYGAAAYYSSDKCTYVNQEEITDDCKIDYESSDIKYIIDAWAESELNSKDLWKDELGYSYRLITKQEVLEYMDYKMYFERFYIYVPIVGKCPEWFYNNRYSFWTMSQVDRINSYGENIKGVYKVGDYEPGQFSIQKTYGPSAIRPVVLLKKSAFNKKSNSSSNTNNSNKANKSNTNNTNSISNTSNSIKVSVPDTFTKVSILSITIGIILVGTCVTIYVYIKKRNK